jgi:hypothetical protein
MKRTSGGLSDSTEWKACGKRTTARTRFGFLKQEFIPQQSDWFKLSLSWDDKWIHNKGLFRALGISEKCS